jgi:hypothetical protein
MRKRERERESRLKKYINKRERAEEPNVFGRQPAQETEQTEKERER